MKDFQNTDGEYGYVRGEYRVCCRCTQAGHLSESCPQPNPRLYRIEEPAPVEAEPANWWDVYKLGAI